MNSARKAVAAMGNCRSQIANCRLQIADCKLLVSRRFSLLPFAFCILQFAICNFQFAISLASAADGPPSPRDAGSPSSQRPAGATGAAPAPSGNALRQLLSTIPLPPDPEGAPPPTGNPMKIQLSGGVRADRVEIKESDGLISLKVREEPLNRVLMLLGQTKRLNIVCTDGVNTPVSVTLDKVPLDTALNSIVAVAGCSWTRQNGIIYVTNMTTTAKLAADVQGRQMKVFRLDFASATDMDMAIKGMLSPVGKSFVTASKSTDNRKTQELVVVEDLPGYLQVIEQYVRQVDRPPRQVLIEAHVLSVDLQRDNKCGINFQALIDQLGPLGGLQVTGFADPKAAQAFFFSMNETHMKALVEALATQTNAKTLASPKVLVLNGQEAKIQIGDQLGFRVTTTTETSTLNNVSFLNVGVILKVTPAHHRRGAGADVRASRGVHGRNQSAHPEPRLAHHDGREQRHAPRRPRNGHRRLDPGERHGDPAEDSRSSATCG